MRTTCLSRCGISSRLMVPADSRSFSVTKKYPRVVVNRAGFVAQDEFLVLDRVFEDEICRGFDYKSVVKLLAKLGYLITTKDGQRARYKVDRKIPGQKSKARVYALRLAILTDSIHDKPVLVEWPRG